LHAIIFADRGIQRIGGIIITVGAQVATILTARSDRRTLQVGVRGIGDDANLSHDPG
jgi:hypothetical protein